jgi:hypothetical protein
VEGGYWSILVGLFITVSGKMIRRKGRGSWCMLVRRNIKVILWVVRRMVRVYTIIYQEGSIRGNGPMTKSMDLGL